MLKSDRSSFIGGRDYLDGGIGDDLLKGGLGVDTFIFRTNDGNDTIGRIDINFQNPQSSQISAADFQSGVDQIALIGFGYENSTEAFNHVTDVNGQAIFSDQGLTIQFAELSVTDLDETDFFIF